MKDDDSWVLEAGLKKINKHFKFLFERGYEIYSAKDFPDAGWPIWEVILKREDLFIKMYEERGEFELFIGSSLNDYVDFWDVISAMWGSKETLMSQFFFGWKRFTSPLRKHLDEIECNFDSNYLKFKVPHN